MTSPKPRTGPKSPLATILVWAFALGLFWFGLLALAQPLSTSVDGIGAVVAVEAEATHINGTAFTGFDQTSFDEIQEPMVLTMAKQVFTFVGMNIVRFGGEAAPAKTPVATIGIRG